MKREPWFPLWALFQEDESILPLTIEAEAVYNRSIGKAKILKKGGRVHRVHLRNLCDKATLPAASIAAELEAQGLWVDEGDGWWRIPAYDDWNGPADQDHAAKVDSGRLGNHIRWKHGGELADCRTCNRSASPSASQCESLGSQTRPDQNRPDETRPDPDGSHCDSQADADSAGLLVVELADRILQSALVDPTAVADESERALIAQVLTLGHPETTLVSAAADAATKGRKPRAYLRQILSRLAAEAPTAESRPRPESRPRLDDERPWCGTCAATRWVDVDGGGVARCPDCSRAGVTT
jgi:hypothetical protein